MTPRIRQMLETRYKALTTRETALEDQGVKLMTAALNRPTVAMRAEMSFLLMAVSLMLVRWQKDLVRKLLQRKPPKTPKPPLRPRTA